MTPTRGGGNRRFATVAIVATLITLAAALPLALIAWDARNDEPASSEGLVAIIDGDAVDLAQLSLDTATFIELQVVDTTMVGVSWALFLVDGDEVTTGESTNGPSFVIDVDQTGLDPGLYDLLVTGTLGDGSTVKRAARFEITDPL